ncbi:RNA polymerase sigma factor [Tistrella bauzanensis]|uniref:RNA polymerase sigma factor n=1 Tax=Tistrella bauzanensis TaxID=657419 RepID=A0ABQ1J6Y1_9PROT|nr:sigma-70 family RNA polymerase sigma factor [Tistrella bauzanensis]GGB58972.1 RNA polymerase sigma factor [Tistrella bauzanensis]
MAPTKSAELSVEGGRLVQSFQACYGELLRFLHRRCGDPDRAADLIQDLYFRVRAAEAEGRVVDDPQAYMRRIAVNLVTDGHRRDARLRREHGEEAEALAVACTAPLPDQAVAARERLRVLDAALAALPDKPRQALLLHRVEGLAQAEIAHRLGVSESMVIKYVAQALRHCRDWQRRVEDGGE